ncbi:hypothetical protein K443DRAFT_420244 [Laccaria amethystina LaAM-08-1]|jgi:chitin synthase|uniref:Myosin motor domain-containing protein n=1 Tax=Laccaria amethystina LaAM-08-1 TaxID=1095629 RepID=A0A0C9X905_9AGAR|nr:hypothetical protein K443DRAFT_420244 [Laccaria amethystina LaAM-08-1]
MTRRVNFSTTLDTQLPAAEFALETFGNTRTLFNPNTSRFGKYTEPQFSDCGRLSGVNTLDYYLEPNCGRRGFRRAQLSHLVGVASPEQRQHLHLLDKSTYWYLGKRGSWVTRSGGAEDAQSFDQSGSPNDMVRRRASSLLPSST